ncbi:MAG TPA: hypothetical protein VMU53_11750 [Candidatus Sulfotelmatobacter sp.]|nr:hypothetical protein [Candidatus Sulfotelmatobacter sp.]
MNTNVVRLTLTFCFTLFTVSGLSADQPTPDNTEPVHMVVTAEPHKGADATAVKSADVAVYEGKERDQIATWIPAQGDHAALEFYILIDDTSRSALATQYADIKKFIAAQPPTTKIGIAYMQNGMAHIEQNLTTDHDQVNKAIRLPLGYYGANASPYFSISDLVKKWPADTARHEVLMISNGYDPYYATADLLDPYLEAAITDAQRAGVIVSAIYEPGIGHIGHSYWLSYWGQMYLAKLTEETGGEGYYIGFNGQAPDFSPYLKDLSDRLNHQYILGFIPKPQKKAGMQPVKLKTELHNVDLVGAARVYVPGNGR